MLAPIPHMQHTRGFVSCNSILLIPSTNRAVDFCRCLNIYNETDPRIVGLCKEFRIENGCCFLQDLNVDCIRFVICIAL